jgi:hypothetical protein
VPELRVQHRLLAEGTIQCRAQPFFFIILKSSAVYVIYLFYTYPASQASDADDQGATQQTGAPENDAVDETMEDESADDASHESSRPSRPMSLDLEESSPLSARTRDELLTRPFSSI